MNARTAAAGLPDPQPVPYEVWECAGGEVCLALNSLDSRFELQALSWDPESRDLLCAAVGPAQHIHSRFELRSLPECAGLALAQGRLALGEFAPGGLTRIWKIQTAPDKP